MRVELFLPGAFEPCTSVVVHIARELVDRCADLSDQIARVERDIEQQVEPSRRRRWQSLAAGI
jgi:anti-sigma factor ChrR (cupin superfamily)